MGVLQKIAVELKVERVGVLMVFLLLFFNSSLLAQEKFSISGLITSSESDTTIAEIFVSLKRDGKIFATSSTNKDGKFQFNNIPSGQYLLQTSTFQHKPYSSSFLLDRNRYFVIKLDFQAGKLDDVFVMAKESKSMTSASTIDRNAMRLLQPSSFTDLLELLPGGRSSTPSLTSMNKVALRDVSTSNDQHNTSALGTGFFIDGAPVNTNANIQTTSGFTSSDPHTSRSSVNKGVDMRSISTDQIESVEVIRGIPSVEYGDITSGAIIITRKKGASPFSARLKADGFSKLYSIGKGFSNKKKYFFTNIDLDFLNANAKPTDSYTNYKRISVSIRTDKVWDTKFGSLELSNNFDYGRNIDNVRVDPDNAYDLTDKYKSYYNSYNYLTRLKLNFNKKFFFRSVELSAKINYQQDKVVIDKWMQPRSATVLANSIEAGAHDVGFLVAGYTGHMVIDGQPLNLFFKANTNANYITGQVKHQLKLGTEFTSSQNLGKGQQYDLNYPVGLSGSVQVGGTTRPRAFNTIPAMEQLAVYAENTSNYKLGRHHLSLQAGLRAFTMLNLDKQFDLARKLLFNPRINAKWQLPGITYKNKPLIVTVGGGIGLLSKTPTLSMLYPTLDYTDLIQLNYYHNNPAYRTANVMTYITDRTNYALQVAKNYKQELNLDLGYNGYRLSITVFNEILNSGFRSSSMFRVMDYKKYDNTSINADTLTQKPSTDQFSYTDTKEYYAYSVPSNGSKQVKQGVEYQFTSKRLTSINTRLTINGAWFKTRNADSQKSFKSISPTIVTDGKVRQYIGVYKEEDGTYYEQFNTNLTLDSYIPVLGLNVATSFQSLWYRQNQMLYKSGTPLQYLDINGGIHDYTEADKRDPNLQNLNTTYSSTTFEKYHTPIDLNINMKLSKTFSKNRFVVSMFVNNIFTYKPNYTNENGVYIVRSGVTTPYFGMEMNVNL